MSSRDLLRDEHRRRFRATAAASVLELAPGLSRLDIDMVLGAARAEKGIALRELAEHLADHPDALTSGDARCPAVIVRLTHVLHDAGHVTAIRPPCSGCGKITRNLSKFGPDGRVCQWCAVRGRLKTCARCGRRDTRIAARRAEGGICRPCYNVDPEVVEDCASCGRSRIPMARRDDGAPLCSACRTPPTHRCDLCGQDRPVGLRGPTEVVCRDCYQRYRRRQSTCGRCGRFRFVAKRATDTTPDLCDSCNRGPEMVCTGCGRVRPSRRRGVDALWLCGSCAPRRSEACSRCGQTRPVQARWPRGPLCQTCHASVLDTPGRCPQCGDIRVLVARTADGELACGPCVGVDLDPRCATCGRPGRHHTPGKCAHCVLRERLVLQP